MPLNFPDTWGVRKDYTEEIKEGDYVEVIDIAPTSKKYEKRKEFIGQRGRVSFRSLSDIIKVEIPLGFIKCHIGNTPYAAVKVKKILQKVDSGEYKPDNYEL